MVDRRWFVESAEAYARAAEGSAFPIDWSALHPCDDREGGASIDRHYFWCDLWAAQHVLSGDPFPHIDVGSRVDGFVAHLLAGSHAIIGVTHVDIRPPPFEVHGLHFLRDDARTLSEIPDGLVSSASCLHAAEHAGLGRYSDPIDPDGMAKVMQSLARILSPGGRLYFAVPVGKQRVCFNAHRIASPSWVVRTFAEVGLSLASFAAVDDAGSWHPVANTEDYEGAVYSCGMFEMRKPR